MESLNQKSASLERVVSQKALQMGSSFPCQICVVGFLCGVCLTTLFMAVLTTLGTFGFGGASFFAISPQNSSLNSSSQVISKSLNLSVCSVLVLQVELLLLLFDWKKIVWFRIVCISLNSILNFHFYLDNLSESSFLLLISHVAKESLGVIIPMIC